MDYRESKEDKIVRLERAEARIQERAGTIKPWPDGTTAEEMLADAKDKRIGIDVED